MTGNGENGQPSTPCRTCGKAVAATSRHAPFCSKRCRDADLGAWFNESYTLSRPITEEDDLDGLEPPPEENISPPPPESPEDRDPWK